MIGAVQRTLLAAAAVAAAAIAAVLPAAAETASDWQRTDQTAVRLVSAVTATGGSGSLSLGLQFRMEPGWKVYWRSPGSGGLPPSIDWQGSDNAGGAEVLWPAPKRFDALGIESFGYADEVVLPIRLAVPRPDAPVRLTAAVDYLTCREICIPYQATLRLDVPAGPAQPSPEAALVGRFLERVPGDGAAAGLGIEQVALVRSGERRTLVATVRAAAPLAAPDLFVETAIPVDVGAPRVVAAGDGVRLEAPVAGDPATIDRLAGSAVTLTLVDGDRAVEAVLAVAAADGLPSSGVPAGLWLAMLATALLGGLVLNLMPCVLPVLSLKLLGVVEAGGRERREVRWGFVAASAGILFSFLLLAGGAIALKSAGLAVGWGIQFQEPWFLTAMAAVLALFAANLWGWFEIPLPGFAQAAAGLPHRGIVGHFLTGALAALLATPCSAPFLGTAVGFALSRGPLEILAIFLALGIGLALPYLTIAAFPGLAVRLPRPGPWMGRVRRVLAIAMAATAIWLLTVLAAQQGAWPALALALVLALAVLSLGPLARLPRAWRTSIAAATVVLFAVAVVPRLSGPPPSAAPVASDAQWRPFERARIAGLVADGRTVFVDVTADWCITCQVNKKLVMTRGEVAERLAGPMLTPMRADWTRPDADIARFLADHGRYGIPFNIVYGPGAPGGIVLPELLTEGAVLDALARAGGTRAAAR
ncbi:protein-disulfide reductase DsbD family protein [Stella sp.]|uniref:protein-disulfide reductase DsbD family protein n=1 Tax=Stella sp. TaxID=2912054 RepID=UPI0035AEDC39